MAMPGSKSAVSAPIFKTAAERAQAYFEATRCLWTVSSTKRCMMQGTRGRSGVVPGGSDKDDKPIPPQRYCSFHGACLDENRQATDEFFGQWLNEFLEMFPSSKYPPKSHWERYHRDALIGAVTGEARLPTYEKRQPDPLDKPATPAQLRLAMQLADQVRLRQLPVDDALKKLHESFWNGV